MLEIKCYPFGEILNTNLSEISPEHKRDAIEGYLATLFKNLFDNGYSINHILGEENGQKAREVFNTAWQEFSQKMLQPATDLLLKYKPSSMEEFEQIIKEKSPGTLNVYKILKQKQAFFYNTQAFLGKFGASLDISHTPEQISEWVSKQENEVINPLGILDGVDIDPRSQVKSNVKLLLATLPKLDRLGNPKKGYFGLDKLEDYGEVNKTLVSSLTGLYSFNDMMSRLSDRFGGTDKGMWVKELQKRLKYNVSDPSQLTREDVELRDAFEVSFAKNVLAPQELIIGKDGSIYSVNPTDKGNIEQVKNEWVNNLKENIIPGREGSSNTSLFKAGADDIYLDTHSPVFKDFIKPLSFSGAPSSSGRVQEVLDKLAKVGIDLKTEAGNIKNNRNHPNYDLIYNTYKNITEGIKAGKITTVGDIFDAGSKWGRNIKELSELSISLNPSNKSFSFLNPNDDTAFSIIEPSTAGRILDSFVNAKNKEDFLAKNPFLNTPYHQRSMYMELLFTPKGNKRMVHIPYTMVTGMSSEGEVEGTTTNRLGMLDRMSQEINFLMRKTIYLGINSDKSREMAIELPSHLVSFKDSSNPEILYKHYLNGALDEMDAAWAEISNPSKIDNYQDEVLKLGMFRGILGNSIVGDFIRKVLGGEVSPEGKVSRPESALEGYEGRRDKWVADNTQRLKEAINGHINSVSDDYINQMWREGVIKKRADGTYHTKALSLESLNEVFGHEVDPTNLSQEEMKSLSRFLNVNFELNRNEQYKLFFGHPAQYRDIVKRMPMIHGTKAHQSTDGINDQWRNINYPRLDGRTDNQIRHFTYKEPLYIQQGFENILENMWAMLSPVAKNKSVLEKHLGAKFNEDGTLKELITDKGDKTTGIASNWLNIKGADSQVYFMGDYYWRYRQKNADMSPGDWGQMEYETAFEIVDRAGLDKKDPAYKDFGKNKLKWAKRILEKYNNTSPDAPQTPFKPQYFGPSYKEGVMHTVAEKMSVVPLFWSTVKGSAMEDAYIAHQDAGADMFGFESAQKVGAILNENNDFEHFYNEYGRFAGKLAPTQYLYQDYMGKQTEVPAMKDSIMGSQEMKQILSNIHPKYRHVVKELMDTYKKWVAHETEDVMRQIGVSKDSNNNYYTEDARGLVQLLKKNAYRWGVSDNQINSIAITEREENGRKIYILSNSLDSLPSRQRIENIIWSMVNHRIVNRRYYGVPAVQASSLGLESKNSPIKYGILNSEGRLEEVSDTTGIDRNKLFIISHENNIPQLKGDKVTPAKVIITWPRGINITPREAGLEKNKQGRWVDTKQVLPKEFYEAIGFRIPTLNMSSITPMEIAEFHDLKSGDVANIGAGNIVRDGSDFDVDKLNTILNRFRVRDRVLQSPEFRDYLSSYLKERGVQNPEDIIHQLTPEILDKLNSFDDLESIYPENSEELYIVKDAIKQYKGKSEKELLYVSPEEESSAGYQNKINKLKRELLLAPEHYTNLMSPTSMGSIPDLAKEVREIKGIKSEENNYTKVSQLGDSQSIRHRYLTFKNLVGIAARASTLHVVGQLADTKLTGKYHPVWFLEYPTKKSYTLDSPGDKEVVITLPHTLDEAGSTSQKVGEVYDAEGNLISTNHTETSQAYVDGPKNPAAADLNINLETAATWSYLAERGVPTEIRSLFFPQPILVDYVNELGRTNSLISSVNGDNSYPNFIAWKVMMRYVDNTGEMERKFDNLNKQIKQLGDRLNEEWAKDTQKSLMKTLKERTDLVKDLQSKVLPRIKQLGNTLFTADQLRKGLTSSPKSSIEERRDQVVHLYKYLEYKQQAAQLRLFNDFINYDTRRPNTFAANSIRGTEQERVMQDNFVNDDSVGAVMRNTFLGGIQKAIREIPYMFQEHFTSLHPSMEPIIYKMADTIQELKNSGKVYMSGDDWESYINKYNNFALSWLIHTTPGEDLRTISDDYQKMLFGSKTIGKQAEYLRKHYPDSILTKAIQPLLGKDPKDTDNIRLFKNNYDAYDVNLITDSALNLYRTSGDPHIKEWLGNLGKFSLIQTGLQGGRNDIQKILPIEIYTDIVSKLLSDGVKRDLTDSPDLVFKQFYQNNWWDKRIVPNVPKREVKVISGGLAIGLESSSRYSQYPYLLKTTLKKLPKEQIQKNIDNGEADKNFIKLLYERIEGTKYDDVVYYKVINKKGKPGSFTEAYSTDEQKSKYSENAYINEDTLNLPEFLREVKKEQISGEKEVTLPEGHIEIKPGEIKYTTISNDDAKEILNTLEDNKEVTRKDC